MQSPPMRKENAFDLKTQSIYSCYDGKAPPQLRHFFFFFFLCNSPNFEAGVEFFLPIQH